MRKFSDNVKQILSSNEVSLGYLVEIMGQQGALRDTTLTVPVTFNGKAYDTNGGLLSVEPPRLSGVVDREPYKIVYIDAEFQKLGIFESGIIGASVTVHAVFLNTIAPGFAGVSLGAPMLADALVAYKGVVDSHGYTIDPDNGSVLSVIECASPMAALGLSRPFFTSKEAMSRVDATDSSFDEIEVGAQEVAIAWGKI